jgi:hypothetical protein
MTKAIYTVLRRDMMDVEGTYLFGVAYPTREAATAAIEEAFKEAMDGDEGELEWQDDSTAFDGGDFYYEISEFAIPE